MGLLDTEAMAEALRNWAPNGLLAKVYSSGDSAKRYVKGLLSDPSGTVQQWMDQGLPTQYEAQQAMNKAKGQKYNPDAVAAYDQKHQALAQDSGLAGLTVWHGSPHKFSKFDMSKIGTGEGAQAYGHGLYMAENPIVAKEYQNMVRAELDGKPFTPGAFDPEFGALDALHKAGNDYSAAEALLKDRAARQKVDLTPEIDALASMQKKGVKANLGAMYKVDIPDEAVARMLDWDKPLSQQSPEARAAITKYLQAKDPELFKTWSENGALEHAPAGSFVPRVGQSSVEFADALRASGIPGLRYLDGGSRGTGSGTSNYVLFSDQLPRILETNGVPTGQAPWAPGEWQGLLQSQPW